MKLSVVVPGWHDPLMQKTIDTLLETSELGGDLEVIAVIDGPWLKEPLKKDSRVKVIQFDENRGMRAGINAGLANATGKYFMKTDAHCTYAPGFDKAMVENCEDNWLVIPRRYSLDDNNWCRIERKPYRDYLYLNCPFPGQNMTPQDWIKEDNGIEIDDMMTFQGSNWIANREYFMKRVGFLDDRNRTYGSFAGDQLEVGLKYWLTDGEVKVNKKTWYAHLWKMTRHYASGEYRKKQKYFFGWRWCTKHWFNNQEPGMDKPFSWVVEKFWPVPTWPEDWQKSIKV